MATAKNTTIKLLSNQSSVCPRSSTTSRQANAIATDTIPHTSIFSRPAFRAASTSRVNSGGSFSNRLVRISETIPIGIWMKKIHRLLHRRQSSAAPSLQNPKKNQQSQARRKPAQQRTDRKQRHADHVVALPPENPAQPRRKRQHHRVRNQVARQHPRALVRAHSQSASDVRQRHVGNRRIQQFHERRQGHRNRDEP